MRPNAVALSLIILSVVLPGCAERTPEKTRASDTPRSGSAGAPNRPDGTFTAVDTMPIEVLATTPVARASLPTDWFEDVTEASGVQFTYWSGMQSRQYAMVEEVGGGVALFDYDNDGDLDVYVTGGGEIAAGQIPRGRCGALFRNDGGLKFSDVTQSCGLGIPADYSHGVTVGDFDRDGWQDLFITAYGRSRLYRNDEGRTFVDWTQNAGLDLNGFYTAAAFWDFDRDGWLDLYICGYTAWKPGMRNFAQGEQPGVPEVSTPADIADEPDLLFRGSATGRFINVSKEAGLKSPGKGLGLVAADLNQDGWTDLYQANDVGPNFLYLSGPELPLREVALVAGVSGNEHGRWESGMGVDAGDYDGDGRLDLFVANYEGEDNSLYHNDGAGLFTHRSALMGLAGPCRPYVGFAAEFVDFDLDGWLDLYVLNGHVLYHNRKSAYRQPAVMYRNLQGPRFADVSNIAAPYFAVTHVGRGAAHGDLDNDGDVDLILVHQNEPVTILSNRLTPPGWIRLSLEGVASNRDAIAAVVTTQWEGRSLTRVIRGGGSYLSCSDRRIVVPCSSEPQNVHVSWPSGHQERFSGLSPRRTHQLREGSGERSPVTLQEGR